MGFKQPLFQLPFEVTNSTSAEALPNLNTCELSLYSIYAFVRNKTGAGTAGNLLITLDRIITAPLMSGDEVILPNQIEMVNAIPPAITSDYKLVGTPLTSSNFSVPVIFSELKFTISNVGGSGTFGYDLLIVGYGI